MRECDALLRFALRSAFRGEWRDHYECITMAFGHRPSTSGDQMDQESRGAKRPRDHPAITTTVTRPLVPSLLRIVCLSFIRYLDKVIHSIENGLPLLLENLPQDIDAVLDPVIQKVRRR